MLGLPRDTSNYTMKLLFVLQVEENIFHNYLFPLIAVFFDTANLNKSILFWLTLVCLGVITDFSISNRSHTTYILCKFLRDKNFQEIRKGVDFSFSMITFEIFGIFKNNCMVEKFLERDFI